MILFVVGFVVGALVLGLLMRADYLDRERAHHAVAVAAAAKARAKAQVQLARLRRAPASRSS